ncbi:MAG: hypothetical protein ABIH50_06970 [bacterium]
MKKVALFLVIGLLFVTKVSAEVKPFAELWNNVAYYDSNIERKGFTSILGRFEGKVGAYLLDTPVQLYGAYYAMASQSPDYWDNAIYYGPGIRVKPFETMKYPDWYTAWIPDVKVFYESLSSTFLKDNVSGEANKRSDTRYGFDVWHEWNLDNPDVTAYWGELWGNLSMRSTNFSYTDFNSYVLYVQPKIGRHLGRGIETYVRADLTYSGTADYWLNVLDYGVGVRFEPWRSAYKTSEDSLLKKLKMFVEVLGVSYLKDKPTDPSKNVSTDVRFGVDFSYGR